MSAGVRGRVAWGVGGSDMITSVVCAQYVCMEWEAELLHPHSQGGQPLPRPAPWRPYSRGIASAPALTS